MLLVNSIEGADVKNQPQRKDGGIICTEKIMIILMLLVNSVEGADGQNQPQKKDKGICTENNNVHFLCHYYSEQ